MDGTQCGMFLMPNIDTVAFTNAHFGAGVGPVYLDNVDCTGSEANLTDCSSSFNIYCYRGHSEDAGVRCQGSSAHSCICSSYREFVFSQCQ